MCSTALIYYCYLKVRGGKLFIKLFVQFATRVEISYVSAPPSSRDNIPDECVYTGMLMIIAFGSQTSKVHTVIAARCEFLISAPQ